VRETPNSGASTRQSRELLGVDRAAFLDSIGAHPALHAHGECGVLTRAC
jgi:hypothetical protein